jgi:hypothetical protein
MVHDPYVPGPFYLVQGVSITLLYINILDFSINNSHYWASFAPFSPASRPPTLKEATRLQSVTVAAIVGR